MVKFSKMDLGILPYLKWSSLQQLVTLELTTSGQYLHVAVVTQLSLLAKLKSDENGHVLKAASDTFSYFVDMLLYIFFYFCNFCFTNMLLHYKNENLYHCRFHLLAFYYQKQPSTYVLEKLIKCRKNICEGVLF